MQFRKHLLLLRFGFSFGLILWSIGRLRLVHGVDPTRQISQLNAKQKIAEEFVELYKILRT